MYGGRGHAREIVLLGCLFMGSLKERVAQMITARLGLVDSVASRMDKQLAVHRDVQVQKMPGVEENVTFKLPRELTHSAHFTGTTS